MSWAALRLRPCHVLPAASGLVAADEARRARKHFAYVFDTYRNWEPVDFYDPRMHHLTGTNILHLLIDLQTYLGLMFGRWNVTRH